MSCSVCRGYDSHACPSCGQGLSQVLCPVCGGDGFDHRLAFNIRTRQYEEVTELTWLCLPISEEAAEARGWNYCKAEESCLFCKGRGIVYQNDRSEYQPII